MKIAIPDDYQDALQHLVCFSKLAGHDVLSLTESIKDAGQLAERLQDAEALVLIRDRTRISEDLLARLPKLRVIVQTGKRATHIDMEACTRHGVGVILSAPERPELS
jgi:D-3-phosphoglycerate dehydrogenase